MAVNFGSGSETGRPRYYSVPDHADFTLPMGNWTWITVAMIRNRNVNERYLISTGNQNNNLSFNLRKQPSNHNIRTVAGTSFSNISAAVPNDSDFLFVSTCDANADFTTHYTNLNDSVKTVVSSAATPQPRVLDGVALYFGIHATLTSGTNWDGGMSWVALLNRHLTVAEQEDLANGVTVLVEDYFDDIVELWDMSTASPTIVGLFRGHVATRHGTDYGADLPDPLSWGSLTTPVTFVTPIPNRTFRVGDDVAIDLGLNFIGTETPFDYTVQEGALPSGLVIAGSTISGIPASADTQTGIVIRATDTNQNTADTNPFDLYVNPAFVPRKPYAGGALLQELLSMEEGSWKRVNANLYSDVWTPADLRPLFNDGNPEPDRIISAWSGFAWDSNRGDLILYGGGHANYSGNDVYRWRARNLEWERAALPSQYELVDNAGISIDGADHAPPSCHTYGNSVFLPIADRYLNFGGAIFNTGGRYQKRSEGDPDVLRNTGPYLFNPARADPWKVGGTTGSHVQRVAPFPEIVGGEMWENRDLPLHLGAIADSLGHINGCVSYSPESDYDAVFIAARTGGGTSLHLFRYEMRNILDVTQDTITQVGVHQTGPSTQTAGGYSPHHKCFLRIGNNSNPLYFWDLSDGGSPTNQNRAVSMTGGMSDFATWLSGFTSEYGYEIGWMGLDYDPVRENYMLWSAKGDLWRITPSENLTTTGWVAEQEVVAVGEAPTKNTMTGVLGKWKYIPGYDCFIGLQDHINGEIWVYKPYGWVQPPAPGGSGGGMLVLRRRRR